MLAVALMGLAEAAELRVVRSGDTVESLAGDADPAEVRALNGLSAGAQPVVGATLTLPGGGRSVAAEILGVTGSGRVTTPSGPAVFAAFTSLPDGSVVCTDADSFAVVRLAVAPEGGAHDDINLFGNTCVTVIAANTERVGRSSLVGLERGSVSVRNAADRAPGVIAVRTPFGTSAGVGGGFRVHVEADAARTEALYRPVSVFGAGVEVPMGAGKGNRVRAGQAPGVPVDLLVPGEPERPTGGDPLRVPDFVWSPVDRALGYRVEIASSPDFADILMLEDVSAALWQAEVLLLPFRVQGWWWRVSSFDRTGFLGVPSDPAALSIPPGVGP